MFFMKSWFKILAFVVLGAFAFPNMAKLLHHCEATHQYCDHHHADEKQSDGFASNITEVSNHNCYICNFHYAGFEVETQLFLNHITNTYQREFAARLQRGYNSILFSSNPHRGPPNNLV